VTVLLLAPLAVRADNRTSGSNRCRNNAAGTIAAPDACSHFCTTQQHAHATTAAVMGCHAMSLMERASLTMVASTELN